MKIAKLTDQELLAAYGKGDTVALSQLIERHRSRVLNYIMILVKDRDVAQDIFQETFIKVIRFLDEGRYAESGKFLPWVLRIAHNQVIDHFRQNKAEGKVSQNTDGGYDVLNHPRFSDKTIEETIVSSQAEEQIRALIDQLPPEQKDVVTMRYYNGLSFKDIADQTDVSINTALGRMRYALINLRKKIEEKNLF